MVTNTFNISADEWKAVTTAAEKGDLEAVRAYLDAGGDVNRNDGIGGATLLMWTTLEKRDDIAALLLERGADVNIPDTNYRETALHWAATTGAEKIAAMILEKNPGIDLADSNGQTALMATAIRGQPEVARLLLGRGATIDLADHEGKTALDHAKEVAQGETVEAALKRVDVATMLVEVAAKREADAKAARDAIEAALKLTAETIDACRNGTRQAVTLSRRLQFKPPVSAR